MRELFLNYRSLYWAKGLLRVRVGSVYSVHDALPAYEEETMLLARLVTVRPAYALRETEPRRGAVSASSLHWLMKVLTAVFFRK